MTGAEVEIHTGYRHESFLWSGPEEFLAGTVPFITAGVTAGQPVMVAVIAERCRLLGEALGDLATHVRFVDMAQIGRNPSRVIPAWREFAAKHAATGQPVRGIGEPVWNGRRAVEISECQLHEGLLNLALDPSTPLWLRCPYEVDTLDASVIVEADRSHPIVLGSDGYRGSTRYGGMTYAEAAFAEDLPPGPEPSERLRFGPTDLPDVRRRVRRFARRLGVGAYSCDDLALAAHEAAINSLEHGGGSGQLSLWCDGDGVVVEVRDHGLISDLLVGRQAPTSEQLRGRGLWIVNQLCDLVQIRSGAHGTVVRLHTWL